LLLRFGLRRIAKCELQNANCKLQQNKRSQFAICNLHFRSAKSFAVYYQHVPHCRAKTPLQFSDSLAIDAGHNFLATDIDFDQRGKTRIVDWDGDSTLEVDIGAVELAFDKYYES